MVNEEKIVFEREGQQQPEVIPGDVILILKQKKHKRFSRVENDLYTEMKLTLEEALLGFSKPMKMLDNRTIEIRSESGEIIQPFSWKVIEGEGMPLREDPSEKGKLHIKFKVSVPKKLTDKQKELVEKIFKEDPQE
uniref:Chaperone DnaJ C-terminal domain-containing protein n=1 Tax=Euplotes crassus TaxID=5936 RepID=A0A7S3KDZ5_EUPCR|mmetsp:Transcript_22837/g.22679  ORF Transcript_22837/g.22679 Transcript_22837/m.22679 type:complete len:136 (+) Transcript_22837:674-1081(+)